VEVDEPGRQPLRTPLVLTIGPVDGREPDEVIDFSAAAYRGSTRCVGSPAERRERWEPLGQARSCP
jgi:hypothetical protein